MSEVKKIVLVFFVLFIIGCSQQVRQLQSAEVREYNGERLDSVTGFRENSIKGVQYVDIDNYTLDITGLVEKPLSLTYDKILDMQKYSKVITLYCVEGWDVKALWEGVLVKDLLEQAEVKKEANTLIFYAHDGYTTTLPLRYVLDNDIIIANKINNMTLPPANGFPFQLVAEDKWGYKWIRWLTKIEVSDDPNVKGFWEQRGYNQQGDFNGSKFEI